MKSFQVIVETPRGSAEKYSYNKKLHLFELKKILPAGMSFPYDFGFFPGTVGGDGDPVDALVLSEFRSFPGCLMDCRIIGALVADQKEKGKKTRNDRFFTIPAVSKVYQHITAIRDIPKKEMTELINFFIVYNLQEEKEFEPVRILNPHDAAKLYKKYRQQSA